MSELMRCNSAGASFDRGLCACFLFLAFFGICLGELDLFVIDVSDG